MALKNYQIQRDFDRGELKKALVYAFILVIFFSMVIVYLRQSVCKVRIENEINLLTDSKSKLLQINQSLRLERGYLRSLDRIESQARHSLGLTDPLPGQLIFVEKRQLLEDEKD